MTRNKLVKCKTCGAEIARSAKVCPNCGARNKKGIGRILIGTFLLMIGLFVAGASLGGGNNNSKIKKEYEVGERVELNDVAATLVEVKEEKGSTFNKPVEGNVFILCEFEIENNSDKELNISSMVSFAGYCDDHALNYSLTALLEKGNKNQLDGTVAPGKKFNGVIGYEVSKDWKELEIKFTPDVWSSKDITFVVNR